jgi:dTMP kinase
MEDALMAAHGVLITLEGNEGCGKSTQIKLLYRHLKRTGRKVFWTREPGGTKVGDRIREVLLDTRHEISPVCETLLYMASRAQLVSEVVKPRLAKGEIVLCDRWLDATVAYQGYAGGVDVRWIETLGREATQGIVPKLTLYLDLPVREGLRRTTRHKAADRMERKSLAFHEKVRKGFLTVARKEPKRFRRLAIRKEDSIENVQARIRKEVFRVLG